MLGYDARGDEAAVDYKPHALSFNSAITINKTRAKSVKYKLDHPRPKSQRPEVTISMFDGHLDNDFNYSSHNESDDSDDVDFEPSAKKSKKKNAAKSTQNSANGTTSAVSITKVRKTAVRPYKSVIKTKRQSSPIYQCKVCLISYTASVQMEKCIEAHRKMIDLDRPAEVPELAELSTLPYLVTSPMR